MRLADRVARIACVSSVAEKSGWQEPEESQRVQGVVSLCGETCFAPAKEDFEDIPSLTLRATGTMGGPDIADVWLAKPQDFIGSMNAKQVQSCARGTLTSGDVCATPAQHDTANVFARHAESAGQELALQSEERSTTSPR